MEHLHIDGVSVLLAQGLVLLGVEGLALKVQIAHLWETDIIVNVTKQYFFGVVPRDLNNNRFIQQEHGLLYSAVVILTAQTKQVSCQV